MSVNCDTCCSRDILTLVIGNHSCQRSNGICRMGWLQRKSSSQDLTAWYYLPRHQTQSKARRVEYILTYTRCFCSLQLMSPWSVYQYDADLQCIAMTALPRSVPQHVVTMPNVTWKTKTRCFHCDCCTNRLRADLLWGYQQGPCNTSNTEAIIRIFYRKKKRPMGRSSQCKTLPIISLTQCKSASQQLTS
jgi:hypothetical protein